MVSFKIFYVFRLPFCHDSGKAQLHAGSRRYGRADHALEACKEPLCEPETVFSVWNLFHPHLFAAALSVRGNVWRGAGAGERNRDRILKGLVHGLRQCSRLDLAGDGISSDGFVFSASEKARIAERAGFYGLSERFAALVLAVFSGGAGYRAVFLRKKLSHQSSQFCLGIYVWNAFLLYQRADSAGAEYPEKTSAPLAAGCPMDFLWDASCLWSGLFSGVDTGRRVYLSRSFRSTAGDFTLIGAGIVIFCHFLELNYVFLLEYIDFLKKF